MNIPDPEAPVIGDGVVTLPGSPHEELNMALDLPQGVGTLLMTESATNVQTDNRNGRATATLAEGVLQAAMARNFDELGTVEGRANSGVNATPIASPAVQSGT